MGCIYMMILYALRINMGIAIVCMVKPTNETINLDANVSQTAVDECPGLEVSNNASIGKAPVSQIIGERWDFLKLLYATRSDFHFTYL